MKRFTVSSASADRFGLAALCQTYCDEQWTAAHATPEQDAAILAEQFKRAILQELQLIEITCFEDKANA